jgi:hypothetical protein
MTVTFQNKCEEYEVLSSGSHISNTDICITHIHTANPSLLNAISWKICSGTLVSLRCLSNSVKMYSFVKITRKGRSRGGNKHGSDTGNEEAKKKNTGTPNKSLLLATCDVLWNRLLYIVLNTTTLSTDWTPLRADRGQYCIQVRLLLSVNCCHSWPFG